MIFRRVLGLRSVTWQRELLHLSALFMEIVWCILLFIAFAPGASLLPTPNIALYVTGNLLLSMLLVRFLTWRMVHYDISRWIVLGALIAACALALYVVLPINGIGKTAPLILKSFSRASIVLVPPSVLTAGLILFFWFRGIRIATSLITPVRASFGFRLGIMIIIILALIPDANYRSLLVALLPLFFFAGLMATMLARTTSLKVNRDVRRVSFGRRWLILSVSISAIVIAGGYLIGLLLAGYGVQGIERVFGSIFSAFFAILVILVTPLLLILEWLLRPLAAALQAAMDRLIPPIPPAQAPDNVVTAAQNLQQYEMILTILKVTALGGVILLITLVVFRLLRNRLGEGAARNDESEPLEPETLNESLQSSLRRQLAGLLNLFGILGRFGLTRAMIDARTIRRLYARLLVRATELGYPRKPAQTPDEYQQQLRAAFPGFPDEIRMITQAYVYVHYGELPDSAVALTAVQSAVDRMIASVEEVKPK